MNEDFQEIHVYEPIHAKPTPHRPVMYAKGRNKHLHFPEDRITEYCNNNK